MLDIAVIGAGPAGLSAAINGVQRNKKVKVFGRAIDTSFLYQAAEVDNYLGVPNITGKELMELFYKHAKEKGVEFQESKVTQILSMGDYYVINAENEFIETKTVIIATGIQMSKTIENEAEFLGKGVSYCATCDGMLYKNKTVVVVAENKEGEADANFLSEICKKVFYLPVYKDCCHEYMNENVEILEGKATKVEVKEKVEGIVINDKLISCDGIFFIKNTIPIDSLIFGLETKNGKIKVDKNMKTNLPNIYAAGDCTGTPYQISKAAGEGLIAAFEAIKVLDSKK